jgi:hypothetical protein
VLAAVLAWLLLSDPAASPAAPDVLDEAGATPPARPRPPGPASALVVEPPRPTAEIAPEGSWNARRLSAPQPITEPRYVHLEISSPDGQEWKLTGAALLDILAREFPDTPVRFRDAESLARFRESTWPFPIPNRVHLGMLLTQCPDIGFFASLREGALYMAPIENPLLPDEAEDEGPR